MATVDAIKRLHTSMIDTRRAYEKAHEEAKEPALKTLFGDMAALKQKDHDELHRVLSELGETPDEDGSFMTAVHKTVIAVRSAVKGVDRGALSAFASGEKTIVTDYDDALGQDDIRPATVDVLTRQKSALVTKIGDMEVMSRSQ